MFVEDDNLNSSINPGTGPNEFDPKIEKRRKSSEGLLSARIRLSSVFRLLICLHQPRVFNRPELLPATGNVRTAGHVGKQGSRIGRLGRSSVLCSQFVLDN